jgi:hypothetical protein
VDTTPTAASIGTTPVGNNISVERIFVATTTTLHVSGQLVGANTGEFCEFDNISVKEVIFDRATDPLVLFNHPTNVPRIEYDADGNRKGLLIEEARTNLVLYSEDFANAAWLKSNATVDGNIVIAPNGTLTGSLIYPTATSTSMHVAKTWVLLGFAAQSVYAKAAGKDFLVLRRPDGATANAWFNLSTGEVTSVSAGTASIVPVSNGWYRCTYVSTVPSTNNVMYISTSDANGSLNVTASGTDGIYIWGAQAESSTTAGSFPTSYIKTVASQVTRAADVASIPTSAFGYNQKAGTVVVTGCSIDRVSTIGGTEIAMLAKVAFFNSNATRVFYRGNGTTGFINAVLASSNVDLSPTGALAAGQNLNIAFAYAEDDFATVANGGTVLTDTSAVVAEHTILQIGAGTQYLNGHIKSIQYYPRRLSNAQLQRLTA